jgi:hypothetical protein
MKQPIKSWQYATREEAEAIEREVLTEFAGDVYEGGPVLRSGGDSELFTRDVMKLDSQDDFLARARIPCPSSNKWNKTLL